MRLYGILKTALGALRRNVMRTMLTTLGIVIGVAAVITMMEIGNGASIAIQRTMASIGANTLRDHAGRPLTSAASTMGVGSMMTLTPQDADAIIKECSAVGERGARSCAPARRWCTATATGCRRTSMAQRRRF